MSISTFVLFEVFLSLQKKIIGTLWDIIIIYLIFLHFSVYFLATLPDSPILLLFFLHMSLYDFIYVFNLPLISFLLHTCPISPEFCGVFLSNLLSYMAYRLFLFFGVLVVSPKTLALPFLQVWILATPIS